MIHRLLPRPIDNTYHGGKLAIWFLAIVAFVKILQSTLVIFDGYSIVQSADGVPVATFPAPAGQSVVALFAISAFSRLVLCLLCILVLLLYRSAVPLMLSVLALDYVGRQLMFHLYPLVRTGTPVGPYVNFALFVVTLVALALSLLGGRNSQAHR
jgi:hypothetical protein